MCSAFALPALPPQFLYQAPPGAQQLALPDFLNVPHFGQAASLTEAMPSVFMLVGAEVVSTISFRLEIDRKGDTYCRVVVKLHPCDEIDPNAPVNMSFLLAFERTQAAPQSFCLNDAACKNM